jgi:hypothetical protein
MLRLRKNSSIADKLSLIAALLYAAQSITYVFTSRSMLDEGLYLVKGWFFATGRYTPFQDYGVLTNQMPLSFLIPGYILKWFGPNLLVGRLYAVILGLIALVLLWVIARRLGGPYWAAFAIWGVSLNVALVRIYSLALSQVLIAALLMAVIVLSISRDIKFTSAFFAGFFCGVMVLVRINMVPFLGLWLLYLFWQHGRKVAVTAILGVIIIVLPVHAFYWPNILRLWAYWIPQGWIPALQPFYTTWDKFAGVQITPHWGWLTNLQDPSWDPIISFWQGVRFNFVVFTGILLNILLWPKRKSWPDGFLFKTALFLNISFVVLTLMHMWASLGGQSCTEFCFSGYIAFFSSLGLLAVIVTAPYWRKNLGWLHSIVVVLLLVIFSAGIGFGTADDTGKFLANLPIPRLSSSFPLWGLLENKFGISYHDSRRIIPALTGLAVGISLCLIVIIYYRFWKPKDKFSPIRRVLLAFFALGFVLSPTRIFSLGDNTLTCGGNLIAAYGNLAAELRPFVRPFDRLYYQGPNSPAILLYLPPVTIYPPQLNNVFSFSTQERGSSSDELLRFGYWNQELKDRWIANADLVLIEARRYPEWQAQVEAGNFDILLQTGAIEPCRGKDSAIVLLRAR